MSPVVDLHIHSHKSSDGELSPEEIVTKAAGLGMRALSISDHDTLAAYPEALEWGEKFGIEVIPSVELTTGSIRLPIVMPCAIPVTSRRKFEGL